MFGVQLNHRPTRTKNQIYKSQTLANLRLPLSPAPFLTREDLDVRHPDFLLALVALFGDHAAVGGSDDHLVEGDDCARRINVCCSRLLLEDVDLLTVSELQHGNGERPDADGRRERTGADGQDGGAAVAAPRMWTYSSPGRAPRDVKNWNDGIRVYSVQG